MDGKTEDTKQSTTRRLDLKRFSTKNIEIMDSKALKQKVSLLNTGRFINKLAGKEQMGQTHPTARLFHARNLSELSFHAQKENEQLQKSLNFLNKGVVSTQGEELSINETDKLLQGTKDELLSLSNRLSKIIAKNDSIRLLSRLVPNDFDIDPRSVMFFKILCKEIEPPLRIFIQKSYDSDFVVYVSKN